MEILRKSRSQAAVFGRRGFLTGAGATLLYATLAGSALPRRAWDQAPLAHIPGRCRRTTCRKIRRTEVRNGGRSPEVRASGLLVSGDQRRRVGEVLQRILQGEGPADRVAMRMPASRLRLTRHCCAPRVACAFWSGCGEATGTCRPDVMTIAI